MEELAPVDEYVAFFKALSDASRLRMVGLLAQQPYTVEQLAALLDLGPSTVSHHLSRLSRAGLVAARAEGYYSVYYLKIGALEDMARRLLSREALPDLTAQVDLDSYDRKVVRDYSLPGGALKTIPAQRKKLRAVLRHIAASFEPGRRYSEKQVNEILSHFHEDTAFLRRELVGYGFMKREAGEYWRVS
ncbi:MAG TPA: metalloregulator ArsR/SmtB family transcription factor [Anaerolineaceae bacterium]|nr:metalloregulator ArsR/SmtB family transcription factor [Anaerolineaceae bacterium]